MNLSPVSIYVDPYDPRSNKLTLSNIYKKN